MAAGGSTRALDGDIMGMCHKLLGSTLRPSNVLCAVVAGASLSSCSTFDVYDRYELPAGATPWQANIPGGMVAITFDPDTKFSSAGVLGLPVLPAVAGSSTTGTITLRTTLIVDADHEFSVARSVCFGAQDGAALCTGGGAVFAQAQFDDIPATKSALGWRVINLTGPTDFKPRTIPIDSSSGIINSRDVVQLLGSPFSRTWNRLRVWVTYSVKCNGPCPTTISVDREGLCAVDGSPVFTGTQELMLKRVRDYQPTAAVQ